MSAECREDEVQHDHEDREGGASLSFVPRNCPFFLGPSTIRQSGEVRVTSTRETESRKVLSAHYCFLPRAAIHSRIVNYRVYRCEQLFLSLISNAHLRESEEESLPKSGPKPDLLCTGNYPNNCTDGALNFIVVQLEGGEGGLHAACISTPPSPSPLPEKLTRESFWALAEVTRDAVHAGPLVLARVAEALVDVDLAQFSCKESKSCKTQYS